MAGQGAEPNAVQTRARSFWRAARVLLLAVWVACAVPGAMPAAAQNAPRSASSENWAGYMIEANDITLVHASWVIPTVKGPPDTAFSSAWVGIGGTNSRTLIQAGTAHEIQGGKTSYYLWIETLPDTAVPVPRERIRANPGDAVGITIRNTGGDDWSVKLENASSGQQMTVAYTYASCKCSAEWVAEVPTLVTEGGERGVPPLANFGSVRFSDSYAKVGGATKSLRNLNPIPITLKNRAGQILAAPSEITSTGGGFTVTFARPN